MKHFSWLLTIPLTVVAVVFSVNNIADMPIDLWPFGVVLHWPTYLVVLLAFVLGVVVGGLVMWLSGHSRRRDARRQRAEARRLERELESVRRTPPPAATPPATLPAQPATRLPASAGD